MNESQKDKTSKGNLYKDWSAAIEQLFLHARKKDNDRFISALKPPIVRIKFEFPTLKKRIPYPDDYMDEELKEALKIHSLFAEAVKSPELEREQKMRLMLITFFHLLEADAWHVILQHLLRIINGKNNKKNLRNEDLKIKRKRIVILFNESKKKGINLSMQKLYNNICSKNICDLRNAFFHCQYMVRAQGNWLMITKNVFEKIPSSEPEEKEEKVRENKEQMCYSFSEVVKMYENITAFMKALISKRKEVLKVLPKYTRQPHNLHHITSRYLI